MTEHGLMEKRGDRWSLTTRGYLVSNLIINDLLEAQNDERSQIVNPWRKEEIEKNQITMFKGERETMELFNGIAQ